MRIPERASIIINKASTVTLGVCGNGTQWQCGIFCRETPLVIYVFDREDPEDRLCLEIPEEYRRGDLYSFVLQGELSGLCYGIGKECVPDPYARGYFYPKKTQKDCFGCERSSLASVFCVQEDDRVEGFPDIPAKDLILYKLHVRGYTMAAKGEHPGTFTALKEKIGYIRELGANAVLLMPAYEFHEVPAEPADPKNPYRTPYVNRVNYWGYVDGFYFAPKTAYAATDNAGGEFADMVNAFHRAGIQIMMEFYFREDMAPSVIVEVLRFWHLTYGVDGFRLICGRDALYTVKRDGLLADCRLLAMDFGDGGYHNGGVGTVYEKKDRMLWYDEGFMEAGRHFLRGDEDSLGEFLQKTIRHQNGFATVNFMADQNCFSLMDMVSYERRHNEHNGENNMDGRKRNISFNCGVEGRTDKPSVSGLREKMVKNALTMVLLSSSVPMLMAGDEFGMSYGGNNNPYCQDNEVNYLDWELLHKNDGIYQYTKELIAFRRAHLCLHPELEFSLSDHMTKGMPDLSYHSERAWYPLLEDYSHNIGLLYCGAYSGEECNVYVLYNMHREPHEFAVVGTAGREWELAVTSDGEGVKFDHKKKKIRLQPGTAAVYVSKRQEVSKE